MDKATLNESYVIILKNIRNGKITSPEYAKQAIRNTAEMISKDILKEKKFSEEKIRSEYIKKQVDCLNQWHHVDLLASAFFNPDDLFHEWASKILDAIQTEES